MDIYFGNFITIVSTIMFCTAIAFVIYTAKKQKQIQFWGRRIAALALFGLVLCCFVAARDNYHLSVQASFDTSVSAGLFTIDSIQSTLCCVGGAIIVFSSLSSIFVRNQKYRKIMFFVIGTTLILKTFIIEVSRWMM